jgi:hypothetical protein
MQETSIYLDYLINPAKSVVGNFIHAISDPLSYAGSFNIFNSTIINFYENSQAFKEYLTSNSLNNRFSLRFTQFIDTNSMLAYYNNTTLSFFLDDKLLAHRSFFTDFAHVVYFKNNSSYIDGFTSSYENSDIINELDSLITEADLEAEAQ